MPCGGIAPSCARADCWEPAESAARPSRPFAQSRRDMVVMFVSLNLTTSLHVLTAGSLPASPCDELWKRDYWIVMPAVAELVKLPLVPVMVNVTLPVGVLCEVLRVSVEVPEPVIELGERLGLTRLGMLLTVRFTFELKPPDPVTVIVYLTEFLRVTDW